MVGLLTACFISAHREKKEPSMDSLPVDCNPPLIRTDYSNDDAWHGIRATATDIPADMRQGIDLMKATNAVMGADAPGCDRPLEFVHIVDDSRYRDLTTGQVLELFAKDANACLFIVDERTISDPDHPILVVDLSHERGRTFRAIPAEVTAIASNLSISNMDWEDFANNVGSDGVFHGFPPPNR
jgi:hypothetical protein